MTVGASFENDKDSISEARLGDIMLLELEPTLEVTGSFKSSRINNALPLSEAGFPWGDFSCLVVLTGVLGFFTGI